MDTPHLNTNYPARNIWTGIAERLQSYLRRYGNLLFFNWYHFLVTGRGTVFHSQTTLGTHEAPVNCVAFSDDGDILASGCDRGIIKLWRTADSTLLVMFDASGCGPVTFLKWSRFGYNTVLVAAFANGSLQIIARTSGYREMFVYRQVHTWTAHNSPVEGVDIDENNMRLATCGEGQLRVWTLQANYSVTFFAEGPKNPYTARDTIFFNQGSSVLVTYLESHEIRAWNLSPWKTRWNKRVFTRMGNVALTPSEETLLVYNLIDGLDMYQFPDMTLLRKIKIPSSHHFAKQIAIANEGALAVVGSEVGQVYVSSLTDGSNIQTLNHSNLWSDDYLTQAVCAQSTSTRHFIASGSSTPMKSYHRVKMWSGAKLPADTVVRVNSALMFFVLLLAIIGYFLVRRWEDLT